MGLSRFLHSAKGQNMGVRNEINIKVEDISMATSMRTRELAALYGEDARNHHLKISFLRTNVSILDPQGNSRYSEGLE